MKQITQLVLVAGLGLGMTAGSAEAAPRPADPENALTDEVATVQEQKPAVSPVPRYLIHQPENSQTAPLPRPRPDGLHSLGMGWNGEPATVDVEKKRLRSIRAWAQEDQPWTVGPADTQESEIFGGSGLMTALEDITIPVDFTLGGVVLRWETVF